MKHAIEIVGAMYDTALREYNHRPRECVPDAETVTRIRVLGDVLRALRAEQQKADAAERARIMAEPHCGNCAYELNSDCEYGGYLRPLPSKFTCPNHKYKESK